MSKSPVVFRVGDNVLITKRKCKPFQQPFFKVGSHWIVIGGGDGYLKLQHTARKQGWSKLSFKNYELQKITHAQVIEAVNNLKDIKTLEFLENNLNDEDHNIIAYYPMASEVIALDWAEKARKLTVEHRLNYKKISREIKSISEEYERFQSRSYYSRKLYDMTIDNIRKWRRNFHALDDFKIEQLTLQYCRKNFPQYKHHDFLSFALSSIIAINCYERLIEDASNRLASLKPNLKKLHTMEIIGYDLKKCMLDYFPEGTKFNHWQLDVCVNLLYKQIHEIAFDIYKREDFLKLFR